MPGTDTQILDGPPRSSAGGRNVKRPIRKNDAAKKKARKRTRKSRQRNRK